MCAPTFYRYQMTGHHPDGCEESGRLDHVSIRALRREATLRGDDENVVRSDK